MPKTFTDDKWPIPGLFSHVPQLTKNTEEGDLSGVFFEIFADGGKVGGLWPPTFPPQRILKQARGENTNHI